MVSLIFFTIVGFFLLICVAVVVIRRNKIRNAHRSGSHLANEGENGRMANRYTYSHGGFNRVEANEGEKNILPANSGNSRSRKDFNSEDEISG